VLSGDREAMAKLSMEDLFKILAATCHDQIPFLAGERRLRRRPLAATWGRA
jgi:hypothetical protein